MERRKRREGNREKESAGGRKARLKKKIPLILPEQRVSTLGADSMT